MGSMGRGRDECGNCACVMEVPPWFLPDLEDEVGFEV